MKTKNLNKSIFFFVFYMVNLLLVRFIFFNSHDYEEIFICSVFLGLSVSFYFIFSFKQGILCLIFPIYCFICCVFCVAVVQLFVPFISNSSVSFISIYESLIHNVIVTFIILFPFIIISLLEEFILFKILDNVSKICKNTTKSDSSE